MDRAIMVENLNWHRRQLKRECDPIAIDVLTHAVKKEEEQLSRMA